MIDRRIAPIVAAGLLVFAACGDDDDGGATQPPAADTTGAPTDPTAAPTDATGGVTEPPATGAATVTVASNEELGDVLADAEGRTLYLFEQDEGLTTACTGPCADNWPPLDAADPTAGDGVDAALLETAATEIGENHVAYNGHLLYYFAGDTAPGEINGHGLPGWFAVTPAGEAADAAAGLTSDAGYDY
jgi:predicted lipoprotein with Yx(FWY)xxD motif